MERALGIVVIGVAGLLSLPVAAAIFPDNLILPAQLLGMAGFGALISWQIPGVAGPATPLRKALLIGAGIGLGFALLGVGIFWLLINGFHGA